MTESEEMYLVTIARLKESGIEGPVPLSRLSAELSVLPVSVNQMIRKLEETGLVVYTPYKGVDLTGDGQCLALQVLRHRRLWEVFLVNHLHCIPDEAAALADRMEHIVPEEAAERLAFFLGNPAFSPLGQPIPKPQAGAFSIRRGFSLSQLRLGEEGVIAEICAGPTSSAFLAAEGIVAGARVTVQALGKNGSVLLKTDSGGSVHLAKEIVDTIFIQTLA